jgi:hypothetical protein
MIESIIVWLIIGAIAALTRTHPGGSDDALVSRPRAGSQAARSEAGNLATSTN